MMAYKFQKWYIPNRMMLSIRRYIDKGVVPRGFLQAVICNDLQGAWGYADDENLGNLPAYVAFFCNEAPFICWGSRKKMLAWAEGFKSPVIQYDKEKVS